MFLVLVLLAATIQATTRAPKARTGIYKYQTFTFPRPLQISDEQLIIKDLNTFVHNHSLPDRDHDGRMSRGTQAGPAGTLNVNKTALRIPPLYLELDIPKPYHEKLFSLMKQALYATQDRLKYLQGILDKYQNDRCFRAGYIFTKLDQLIEDMRRIYSFAVKKNDFRSVLHNIIFFKHISKKNIDITYIVEFLFSFHDRNIKTLEKIFGGV